MAGLLDEIANYSRPSAKDRVESVRSKSAPKEGTGKKKKLSDVFINDLAEGGFDMTELESVLRTRGHQLILSCAGSGKTTALSVKINYDFLTGELTELIDTPSGETMRVLGRVWVSTFLRSGAQELRSAVSGVQRRFSVLMPFYSGVNFSTMHAEFMRIIKARGIAVEIIEDKKNKSLLREILKTYSYRFNQEELNQFHGALTYTRNRLDNEKYNQDIYVEKNIPPAIIESIISEWARRRDALGVMDFEDLQDKLYDSLYVNISEKQVELVENAYQHIYLDEFQDTSQKQYAILKVYARKAKKIVAIGDDDQTIYTWRGSSGAIITQDFPADFSPTVTHLSKNFRCPSKILNPVVPSISKNTNRFDKSIQSAKEGGLLRLGKFRTYEGMSRALSEGIAKDVEDGLSVAVLCRTNSDGIVPALMLDKLGAKYHYSVSGRDMTLDSYIGKQVVSIFSLVASRGGDSVARALDQLGYTRGREGRIIADGCKTDHATLWNTDRTDLKYSAPTLWPHISKWLEKYDAGTRGIDLLEYLLSYYSSAVYTSNSEYSQKARSVLDALIALLKSGSYDAVDEFQFDVDDLNERLRARNSYKGTVDVRIATVHEFKGKEADSVYIWNDTNGVFPHNKSKDLEEERRLHYIACTRAKKVSTILANYDKPSMFLDEMDLSEAEAFRSSIRTVL